mmetsp:Transcript_10581/g.25073  ORF Transcript_10581/g.25073 Transcript_10581/m.25073 type:complete len:212 (+) Transcript_10581:348-983(+)
MLGPSSSVKNLNLRHTRTNVLLSTIRFSVISPYIRRSSRWVLVELMCLTMSWNSWKSKLPLPSASDATNNARRRSSDRACSSRHMSTRKKRKESRSIWRPTARFSHSRRILVLTTYGACANTYSTTLMARPDSTCSVSKSGRSGICPFWTFTSPIRNMLSGSTPSGGCFVRPRKRANMRTRADVAIHWFRFATMLISASSASCGSPRSSRW